MNEAMFPAHISAALDRLTVPALPTGFGDRLLARIAAGDLPEVADPTGLPLPEIRRPVRVTAWRRSGRVVMVAVAFGLATATAAASGVFGDAVYIPVVSDALAKADLVALPTKEPQHKKPFVFKEAKADLPHREQIAKPLGKDLVIEKMAELRKDPAYRSLLPEQKLARLRLEFADMLATGKVTKADLKAARQQWHQERKARDQAQFRQDKSVLPQRAAELRKHRNEREPKALSPEQTAKVRDAFAQLSPAQQAELRDLRQRRRQANAAERRAINAEIRAFWQRTGGKPAPQDTDLGVIGSQP
jgi:hypothetical protein